MGSVESIPSLTRGALDALMPMHLLLGASGQIVHAGPTIRKLTAETTVVGHPFLQVFELRRPRNVASVSDLARNASERLRVGLRSGDHPAMKGLFVPLPSGGGIVNLSFGISVVEAVSRYRLTNDDFAATDLAIEMLYLVEAKSAAMQQSRNLNLRLQGARIAAEEQAFTDTLTGLKNRRALEHVVRRLVGAAVPFALMTVDLDFFKLVNDQHGHAAGDLVLQEVARILVEETREQDTAVRIGGDEFVLVVRGDTPEQRLLALAERIIRRIETPIRHGEAHCSISASIGIVSSARYDAPVLERMLADADRALYRSKNGGRGQAALATGLGE